MLIPVFAHMFYKFVTFSPDALAAQYNWNMFLYMTGIFVSLTNQVRREMQRFCLNAFNPRFKYCIQPLHGQLLLRAFVALDQHM